MSLESFSVAPLPAVRGAAAIAVQHSSALPVLLAAAVRSGKGRSKVLLFSVLPGANVTGSHQPAVLLLQVRLRASGVNGVTSFGGGGGVYTSQLDCRCSHRPAVMLLRSGFRASQGLAVQGVGACLRSTECCFVVLQLWLLLLATTSRLHCCCSWGVGLKTARGGRVEGKQVGFSIEGVVM